MFSEASGRPTGPRIGRLASDQRPQAAPPVTTCPTHARARTWGRRDHGRAGEAAGPFEHRGEGVDPPPGRAGEEGGCPPDLWPSARIEVTHDAADAQEFLRPASSQSRAPAGRSGAPGSRVRECNEGRPPAFKAGVASGGRSVPGWRSRPSPGAVPAEAANQPTGMAISSATRAPAGRPPAARASAACSGVAVGSTGGSRTSVAGVARCAIPGRSAASARQTTGS